MARRNIAYNQIGQKFTVYPTNDDDPANIIPLDLTNYSQAHILIRQPDGSITAYPATVIGAAEDKELVGVRVDAEPPIDDTHINDGNDGSIVPASSYAVSFAPINDGDSETYIEIPERGTLVVTSSDVPFVFPDIVFWLFFRGLTGAQIQLRLQSPSAVDTFVSDVISPNATLPVSAGSTSTIVQGVIQRIQNLGTATARYSGWDARISGVPTTPAIHNYIGAHIELDGYTRPFTFVEMYP